MASHRQTQLNLDDLVSDCLARQAGISWPLPVDAKLEQLLQTAKEAGERTSRREIAAAIIAMNTNYTGDELSQLLHRYRLARVGDVLGQPDESNVVPFIHYNSGPRTGGA